MKLCKQFLFFSLSKIVLPTKTGNGKQHPEMAHKLRETSITTPDHWNISRIITESSQGHDRFFLFQLKNTSVEKKKIPNFRDSKRSLNGLFWRMLELGCIPEMRSVVYMITAPGSMTRCWGGGILLIPWRNPPAGGLLIPTAWTTRSALSIRMGWRWGIILKIMGR